MVHRMDPPADPDREPMPEHIVPMLARTAAEVPRDDAGWGFEIKWDGVRAIAYCAPGEVRLESRNLKEISDSYPELGRLDRALGSHQAVLDGEIVAFDEHGRPSFAACSSACTSPRGSRRADSRRTPRSTYMIFDLLWLDGHSLMALPYEQRRELLSELKLDGESWQTPEHLRGHGQRAAEGEQAEQQLEGIVAKRLDSRYEPGARGGGLDEDQERSGARSSSIGGWLPGEGRRSVDIGALLARRVRAATARLRYVGRVGTGFSEKELRRLQKLLEPLRRERSPFAAGERPPKRGGLRASRGSSRRSSSPSGRAPGHPAHPSYKGLREDKDGRAVVREDAAGSGAGRRGARPS